MELMSRAMVFATVLVLGLLASKASLAQSLGATASPPAASPSAPVPPGYHVKTEVRLGLVVSGSIVAGLGYTLGAATLGSGACASDHWLLLPLAGPVIALANESDQVSSGPCDDPEAIRHAIRAWSGIGQGVGGGLLLLAAVFPRTYLVADGVSFKAPPESRRSLAVIPALGPSTTGVAVLGTF